MNQKLSELQELQDVSKEDLLYIVDSSDTTDSPEGTSKKMKVDSLIPLLSKNSTYLPTPKFSYLGTGCRQAEIVLHQACLKSPQTIRNAWNDVRNFPDYRNYYKRYFDVYFDNYHSADWLKLPELRVELCILRKHKGSTKTLSGMRRTFLRAITHPANISKDEMGKKNITNTFFSGGKNGSHRTEWSFDPTLVMDEGKNAPYVNRGKNTNIRIEIDLLGFFRGIHNQKGVAPTPYYFLDMDRNIDEWLISDGLQIKGNKRFNFNGNSTKFKPNIKSLKCYFRLSAAVPESWNDGKQRYDSRMFSDYSVPFKITPVAYGDGANYQWLFSGIFKLTV